MAGRATAEPAGREPPAHEPAALAAVREAMVAGRFGTAAALAEQLLESSPEDAEGLYLIAVSRRHLGDFAGARRALDALRAAHPAFARGWQERGHLHHAEADAEGALRAYQEGVRRNPALLASWRRVAQLAVELDRPTLAREAGAQVRHLTSLPDVLRRVAILTHDGRLWRAERLCRDFLRTHPRHVEGMRLLAALATASGVLDDAEFLLESAVAFAPHHRGARIDYINALHKRQKFERSLAEARRLLASEPANPALRLTFANQAMAAGDFDLAIATYDDIAVRCAGTRLVDERLHLSRGHALKTAGRLPEAIAAYRAACHMRKNFGEVWWSLANLKTYRFDADERASLRQLVTAPQTAHDDRVHALFALGKACEDEVAYADAFRHYARGNELRRRELAYDAAAMTMQLRLQREVCTEAFFRARAGWGSADPAPIFVVGMPRSGSTLLEQILASHPAVDGTLELHHIGAFAQRLEGRRRRGAAPRYPACLADLERDACVRMANEYLAETRVHRRGAPLFIDKMPNNFRHLGLIHLLFPNAKIIDARRHPLACCFGNFKQLFASGQEFSYGLTELGRYYSDYVDLMEHWDRVLPGRVLRVDYETVVADLEGAVRRLLDHCGLPFDERCLRFFETRRSIRTPSSEQVRQPIYAAGLHHWRHFEAWLGPLQEALGHHGAS